MTTAQADLRNLPVNVGRPARPNADREAARQRAATSREAARLTGENYRAQQAIGRQTVREVLALWRAVDPNAVDASWPLLSDAIARVVTSGYADSAAVAGDYLTEHAALYGVRPDAFDVPLPNREQIATALRVTGPVALKIAARAGASPRNAFRSAAVQIAGAAQRLTLLGGRELVSGAIDKSNHVVGYRRVGVGESCDFCSTLISRGGTYHDLRTAGQGRSFHDHDDCQVEPVYAGQVDIPEVAEHLARYMAR